MKTEKQKPRYTVKFPNTSFATPRGWLVVGKTNDIEIAAKWATDFAVDNPVSTFPPKYRAARIIDNLK